MPALFIEFSDQNIPILWISGEFVHNFSGHCGAPAAGIYKVDGKYNPEGECGILYKEPDIAIDWKVSKPIVNETDLKLAIFVDYKKNPLFWAEITEYALSQSVKRPTS